MRSAARALVDQLPSAAALLEGPDHVFTAASAALRRIIGERDPRGLAVREVLPELVEQGFVAQLDAALATGESIGGTDVAAFWDGDGDGVAEEHFFDYVYHPLRDAAGAFTAIIVQIHEITERVRAERERAFLADATEVLASSLDYQATLASVTRLAVDGIADWCVIDELTPAGEIRRISVAHRDPEMVTLGYEVNRRYPPDPSAPYGVGQVIRTGRPEMVADIPESLMVAAARDEEHLRILRRLGLRSYICVPLVVHGITLGVLTLVAAGPARRFGAREMRLAEELARRGAVAIDHARLFRESELARTQLQEQALEMEAQAEALHAAQAGLEAANAELTHRAAEAERAADRSRRLQLVAAMLNEAATAAQVAAACVRHGIEALRAHAGSMSVISDDGTSFEIVHAQGYPDELWQRYRHFPLGSGRPVSDSVIQRRPVILSSRAEMRASYPAIVAELERGDTHAFVSIPVVVAGRTHAALAFGFPQEQRFDEVDHTFLMTLGEQAAQALDRARLLEAERRARADAEDANRVKTEFLSAMSHELRTPLNAIAGYVDLLELGVRGALNPSQLADLARVRNAQGVLLGLIEDILSFARIEAGRIEHRTDRVPLAPLLAELEDVLAPQIRARVLEYTCVVAEAGLHVVADPERMRQILINLLTNAVKFTSAGGRVAVRAERRAAQAAIHVEDTGVGIPADKLGTIFDPFVQLDRNAHRDSQQGVGLGLAISRELALRMGGNITIESEPGVGSVFTLLLPLAPD